MSRQELFDKTDNLRRDLELVKFVMDHAGNIIDYLLAEMAIEKPKPRRRRFAGQCNVINLDDRRTAGGAR